MVQKADPDPEYGYSSSQASRGAVRLQSKPRSSRTVQTAKAGAPRRRRDIIIQPEEGDAELASIAGNINSLFLRSSSSSRMSRNVRGGRRRTIEVQLAPDADSDDEAKNATPDKHLAKRGMLEGPAPNQKQRAANRALVTDHAVQSGRMVHGNVIIQHRHDGAELAMNTGSTAHVSQSQEAVTGNLNKGSDGNSVLEHQVASSSATSAAPEGISSDAVDGLPLQPASLEERWRRERIRARASRTDPWPLGVQGAPNLQLLETNHTRRFDDDMWGAEDAWEDL